LDNEFEVWKHNLIENAIHPQIDKLLDLLNIIQRAKTYEEISEALENGKQSFMTAFPQIEDRNGR